MKIGYARVSTADQDTQNQITRLEAAGCEKIYADHGVSGMKASRPEWDKLTDPANGPLRAGDVVVFTKLDRIGRSTKHLLEIAGDFSARGIDLCALDQPIDTTTAIGKMFFTILAAFAQFERDLISERTKDALAVRTARGVSGGRQPKLSPEQQQQARDLYALTREDKTRRYSQRDLAVMFGVSRPTMSAVLDPQRAERVRKARRDRHQRDQARRARG